MFYIVAFVIAALLFIVLHYFTELDTKQKLYFTAAILGVVLLATAYNGYSNTQSAKIQQVVAKFNQHKTIKCASVIVSDENYTLSIGTYTFIGKKETPFYSQMISVSTCE